VRLFTSQFLPVTDDTAWQQRQQGTRNISKVLCSDASAMGQHYASQTAPLEQIK